MSCGAESRAAGWTLLELLVVILLVALVSVMAANPLRDHVRVQRVQHGLEQARDIATLVEALRFTLQDQHPGRFPVGYNKSLGDFMNDMRANQHLSTLRTQVLGAINLQEDMLGQPADRAYRVRLTATATFVELQADATPYSNLDFLATAKRVESGRVFWTVSARSAGPLATDLLRYAHLDRNK